MSLLYVTPENVLIMEDTLKVNFEIVDKKCKTWPNLKWQV